MISVLAPSPTEVTQYDLIKSYTVFVLKGQPKLEICRKMD